jgi:peptidoglycan hydrolase-like protein with peptidoglycan-binding domain
MHIKTKVAAAVALAMLVAPGVSLAQTQSVVSLMAEIQALEAQLTRLEAQVGQGATAWCYTFNINLSIGMSGNAVTELQTALQKDGESVQVTGTFDDQTASAVTVFQEKYASQILTSEGLTYGTGYAGEATRTELNSLFGCTGSNPVTPPIVVNPLTPPVVTSTPPISCPAWGCNGPEPVMLPVTVSLSPTINSINPSSATATLIPGTSAASLGASMPMTIIGSGFTTSANNIVTFAGISGNEYGPYTVNAGVSPDGHTLNFNTDNAEIFAPCTAGNGTCSVSSALGVGSYNVFVTNANGTSTSVTFTVNTPTGSSASTVTSYNGTINVSADPSTPVAGTVTAGQTSVALAKIDISSTGGAVALENVQVTSDSSGAAGGLSNIQVYNGSTLLGTAANLTQNSSGGGYAIIEFPSLLALSNDQSITLTIVANVASGASGSLRIGIGGGSGKFGGWANSLAYGNTMTVATTNNALTILDVSEGGSPALPDGPILIGLSHMVGYYNIFNPSTEPVTLNQFTITLSQSGADLDDVEVQLNSNNLIPVSSGIDVSASSVPVSVTLNSNAVTIAAGTAVGLGVYANVGAVPPAGATQTTSFQSCSAEGAVSNDIYSCNAARGQTVTFESAQGL